MDVGFVKKQIKNKSLDNFYIFTGDETKVLDIYIDKIAEVTNKTVERVDSVSECYGSTTSLFALPKVFVCRDDNSFIKSEKAWQSINEVLGDNILIFLMSEIDKRTKFYKHFEDRVVVFEHMNSTVLKKYILKEITLSDYWCNELINICESSYSRVLLEIDKIKSYASATNSSYDTALSNLISKGAIYIPPTDAIFNWVDSVLRRDSERAYYLLEDCYRIGEPELRLLMVLYNNFKRVLQVQACQDKDVSKCTGLSSWDIKCVSDKLDYYSDGEIVSIMRMLHNVEQSIKKGLMSSEISVNYAMNYIFTL